MGPVIIEQTDSRSTSSWISIDKKHAAALKELDSIAYQNKEKQK